MNPYESPQDEPHRMTAKDRMDVQDFRNTVVADLALVVIYSGTCGWYWFCGFGLWSLLMAAILIPVSLLVLIMVIKFCDWLYFGL